MIIDQLKADMLTARKARDTTKVTSYSLMISEIVNIGKNDGNRRTSNDEAIALIKKMVLRNEELAGYMDTGPARTKIEDENAMMRTYLPKMVDMGDVETFIDGVVAAGAGNMGAVMRSLKAEYGQTVDMKAAQALVREALK